MTANARAKIALQIKMYTYDVLPVPLATRLSVPFHGSVPTNRTLSLTGPLSVQLKRNYRLHASIKAYFEGKKALGRRNCSR